MAIRNVLLIGNPVLREKAGPVDFSDDRWKEDARDLAETLTYLRKEHGFGRALAGPQIGSPFRLIAFECGLGTFLAANPRITWASSTKEVLWDDCFSLPGVSVGVERFTSVSFEYYDLDGKHLEKSRLAFSEAELVQHEVDHLDGVLMTDRIVNSSVIAASSEASKRSVKHLLEDCVG